MLIFPHKTRMSAKGGTTRVSCIYDTLAHTHTRTVQTFSGNAFQTFALQTQRKWAARRQRVTQEVGASHCGKLFRQLNYRGHPWRGNMWNKSWIFNRGKTREISFKATKVLALKNYFLSKGKGKQLTKMF